MVEFIQLSISGISMGIIYSLAALSITLIYNAGGVVNFAQGALVMFGAYIGATFLNMLKVPYVLALPASILVMGFVGLIFQRFAYYPLRNANLLMFTIAGIGVTVFLENLVINIWGPAPLWIAPMIDKATFYIGGVYIEPQSLAIIVVTSVLLLLENYFLRHTMVGKMTQAVAQDKTAASLMGINVTAMIAITFMNSTMLAGVAGIFIAPIFFVTVGIANVLLKAFSACVIGGFGNVSGTIIGGIIVGLAEVFGARYISPQYRDAWAFVLLILFLFIRPQGIFKEKISEKV